MADDVRSDFLGNSGLDGVVLDDAFDRTGSESGIFGDFALFTGDGGEKGIVHVGTLVEIALDGALGGFGKEYHPDFLAFASHGELVCAEIYVARQGTEFGNAQTGRK